MTAAWAAGISGVSRLLSGEMGYCGRLQNNHIAVRINGWDPEVHSAYALALSNYGRWEEAASEYEIAAALRPRDYSLWLRLGRTYQQLGDYKKAGECFALSTRRATHYAEPHWELGIHLLNLGQRAEAFHELAAAARSNPKLLQDQIDLAWKEFKQDPIPVIDTLKPQTDAMRIALAFFFAKNNYPDAALQMYRGVIDLSEKDRAALFRAFVQQKRTAEAYEVYSGKHE